MMRPDFLSKTILTLATLSLLGGCSSVSDFFEGDDAPPLEGERISILELEQSLKPDATQALIDKAQLPQPWVNSFWPQAGGYPNHAMHRLSLNEGELKRLWRADIGAAGSGAIPMTAQPVVIDGVIYALDTSNTLSAYDTEKGDRLWRVSTQKPNEDDPVIGGGIAYAQGLLYVTNGFDELLAVIPADGEILWRKNIGTPSRAAPTVINGRAFVTTIDNRLLALNAQNGNLLWEHTAFAEDTGIIGAASPAVNQDIVIPVFSSGEIMALRVENGSVAWSESLAGVRKFGGIQSLTDIRAHPVVDQGIVFTISFNGRMLAIDERSGARIWERDIGSANTPWIAGDYIYVLSKDNEVAALERTTGQVLWVTAIPAIDKDSPEFFEGPVLAGNKVIIAGTNGRVITFDPVNGRIQNEWDAGNTIAVPPIVANETLYLLSVDSTLTAYR